MVSSVASAVSCKAVTQTRRIATGTGRLLHHLHLYPIAVDTHNSCIMVYGMLILHIVLVILITKLQDFAHSLIHLGKRLFLFNIIKQLKLPSHHSASA